MPRRLVRPPHTTATLLVLAGGMGLFACRGRTPATQAPGATEPDVARGRAVAEGLLSARLLSAEDAESLTDIAFDRLLESPPVSAAGERLFEKLAAAPELQRHFQDFVAEIPGNAGFQSALLRVMAEDPAATPDEVAGKVAARMESAIDGPDFDAALDQGIEILFDRPQVDAAIEVLVEAMLAHADLETRFAALVLDWEDDLGAAVGVPLESPQFEAEFEAYLAQGDRTQRLEVVISERIAGDPRIVGALAALIDGDAMRNSVVERTESFLRNPEFRSEAIELLAMLATGPEPGALHERTQALLGRPDIADALVGWLEDLASAPETAKLGAAIGEVIGDPATIAELADVLLGTPQGRSA